MPLSFNDDFRSMVLSIPFFVVPIVIGLAVSGGDLRDAHLLLTLLCSAFVLYSIAFMVWTHLLFARTEPGRCASIAAAQHRHPGSRLWRVGGMSDVMSSSLGAAFISLFVAVWASIIGARGGILLPLLVLATVASSWALMVYTFALRYFRLHCAGERITFDIEEPPRFVDFVSMAVMVSSVGALSAGTPRTRASLGAVRTHTFISFAFNALVVAMTVSVLTGFITAYAG